MSLSLTNVSLVVDSQLFINDVNLTLEPGSFNVLLGRTLAGKTSIMRLMAGLDKPTEGCVFADGVDVTGLPIQKRNISMVYQQFINYPHLTVWENIASPLRTAKYSQAQIKERVEQTAAILHIEPYLQRYPLELSGGQQQRTAMARALVKDASLILFDEPLANLDYKLREQLRQELRELFALRNTIAVYATTEPSEALALGGTTTLLHKGRVIQTGSTSDVYHSPNTIDSVELFTEPPINLIPGTVTGSEVSFAAGVRFPLSGDLSNLEQKKYIFAVRPNHIGLVPKNDDDLEMAMVVELAEISGSETFMHVKNSELQLVLHLSGVHEYYTDMPIKIYLPTHKLFVFDLTGSIVQTPQQLVRSH